MGSEMRPELPELTQLPAGELAARTLDPRPQAPLGRTEKGPKAQVQISQTTLDDS